MDGHCRAASQAERLQTVRGRLPVRISGVTNDLRANGLFGKTTDTISSETDGILRKRISGNRSFILHQKADRSSGKVYAISANISRFGRRSDNEEQASLPFTRTAWSRRPTPQSR